MAHATRKCTGNKPWACRTGNEQSHTLCTPVTHNHTLCAPVVERARREVPRQRRVEPHGPHPPHPLRRHPRHLAHRSLHRQEVKLLPVRRERFGELFQHAGEGRARPPRREEAVDVRPRGHPGVLLPRAARCRLIRSRRHNRAPQRPDGLKYCLDRSLRRRFDPTALCGPGSGVRARMQLQLCLPHLLERLLQRL